jgi:starch synthase (maltosyl-transferring)
MKIEDGRKRVVIEGVKPEIDCGRYPVKRVIGEEVIVEADIFSDGHETLSAVVLYRKAEQPQWMEASMGLLANDRWRGSFSVRELGPYCYTVMGWVDRFKTWRQGLGKKVSAQLDVAVDILIGANLIEVLGQGASGADALQFKEWVQVLRSTQRMADKIRLVQGEEISAVIAKYPDRRLTTTYAKELKVVVDPPKAQYSTWYEMFPRSCIQQPGQHGTFADCMGRLPNLAAMGFDVLYFPPIHPIGQTHRKGKNNVPGAQPGEPGSPWAIGGKEGGHKAIHPKLGTLEDFRKLLAEAKKHKIEVALDIAFQCTPDHPYVKEHPQWFRKRPDGTIQYAENPPKKYQDIYPFDFETDDWQNLWNELKSIIFFWIDQGVRIFRVDNPHTKPFAFWEWLIGEVKKDYPEVIFLSEAFTRPKVMYRLAKLGFTQSYTYFAWRNTKWEITEYFSEFAQRDVREYFRPNLWPNTPDILTEFLQMGGRPAFMARLVLAATLGANYGIYGPAFELGENRPQELGSEEYLDSEKYELKHWDFTRLGSLKDFIARVNRIRRENPALQKDWNLTFHPIENDQLIGYSKHTDDLANIILVVVNLDPHHKHGGWLNLSLSSLGLDTPQPYQVHDLLSESRFLWHGSRNYVELDPHVVPAYIFRIRRRVRTEKDFDYFM